MEIKNILCIVIMGLLLGGCEDLEETYAGYAGDGAIRYVGRCSEISVNPGWERLIVRWKNSSDARVKNVKIVWTSDQVKDSVLLDPQKTEYNIEKLEEGSYEVKVFGVDEEGNESLTTPVFGRPYSSNHEAILSFTRLIAKHYFVKNRLVCFFSTWSDEIESAILEYTKLGENKTSFLELDSDLVSKKIFLLKDLIDITKSVVLHRKGRVAGCEDLITFQDYELLHNRFFTTDFKQLVRGWTGVMEVSDEFIENTEVLEIDYTMTSLEDILNLPKLRKLVLGKNRFMDPEYIGSYNLSSRLHDLDVSLFALDVANKFGGLTVECYGGQFLPKKDIYANSIFDVARTSYITSIDEPSAVPEKNYLSTVGWEISCVPVNDGGWDSFVKNLIDGDETSCWQPESSWNARIHEIMIDMKELKKVSGVKIVQKSFNPESDKMSGLLLPGLLKIKISEDNVVWRDATYVEENIIGATAGESTILNFISVKDVRYLKFVVNDQLYGSNYSVALAELAVFL